MLIIFLLQESVEFDCEATDVCNLKASYRDYNVDLAPAHDCMMKKETYSIGHKNNDFCINCFHFQESRQVFIHINKVINFQDLYENCFLHLKGIVSRHWGGLQIVTLYGCEVF
jgi:hypothetical protein